MTEPIACGHGCVCNKATGMATNGPCRCDERTLRRAVAYWRARARRDETALQSLADCVRTGAPLSWAAPECFRSVSNWEQQLETRLRAADAALKESTDKP